MHRKKLTSREIISQNIKNIEDKAKVKGKIRKLEKLALIQYAQLQSIKDDNGNSVFFAAHDPLPENYSHAIVLCTEKYSPSVFLKFREQLFKLFTYSTLEKLFEN